MPDLEGLIERFKQNQKDLTDDELRMLVEYLRADRAQLVEEIAGWVGTDAAVEKLWKVGTLSDAIRQRFGGDPGSQTSRNEKSG